VGKAHAADEFAEHRAEAVHDETVRGQLQREVTGRDGRVRGADLEPVVRPAAEHRAPRQLVDGDDDRRVAGLLDDDPARERRLSDGEHDLRYHRGIRALALIVLLTRVAYADATDCARDAAELRAHLETARRHATEWNVGWAIGYGVVAGAQLGLLATHPTQSVEDTLYVGAAKATLGLLSRLIVPLRVTIPPPNPDACADRLALRAAVADAGRHERSEFWLLHIGSFAVNLAGAIYIGVRGSWRAAAVSGASGYIVGLIGVYTIPRASWHLWRSFTVDVTPTSATVGIALDF
jgi:hypothetical protein